jgi:hypothetical protein
MPTIITRIGRPTSQDKKFNIRIRPLVVLIVLCFLFIFNSIIIYSYEHGLERTHFNVLIYMYANFWVTFFLLVHQVRKITRSMVATRKKVSSIN